MGTDIYNVWDELYEMMCIPCIHRDNAAALVERGGQGDFDMGDAVPIEDELEVYGVEEVE